MAPLSGSPSCSPIHAIQAESPTDFAPLPHHSTRRVMTDHDRNELERLLGELRPKLHRYSARMTGSAVDGEHIVQDAMVEAFIALPHMGIVDNPEAWLCRFVQKSSLDCL